MVIWPLKYLNWCGWEKFANCKILGEEGSVFLSCKLRVCFFPQQFISDFVSLA